MCILIDVNCLPSVFDASCNTHGDFKPVHDWIFRRGGRVVIGGSQYREELGQMRRYVNLLAQLATARKLIPLEDSVVDNAARRAREICNDASFDDSHLVG